jgi:anti-sigma B factor antagonist
MDLKITTKVVEGVTIAEVHGRVVLGDEASHLREFVKDLLTKTDKVILNLRNVSFIDSGGLGVLVSIHTTAQHKATPVKLSQLTPKVDTLLQVTKLLTVFDVYTTDEEAIASFK